MAAYGQGMKDYEGSTVVMANAHPMIQRTQLIVKRP
jgi:hypothetical protein